MSWISVVSSDFVTVSWPCVCKGVILWSYVRLSIQHVGDWHPLGGRWLGVDPFIEELLGM